MSSHSRYIVATQIVRLHEKENKLYVSTNRVKLIIFQRYTNLGQQNTQMYWVDFFFLHQCYFYIKIRNVH